MNVTVREWIQTGREKYHTGKLSDQDFDRLAQLIETKKQTVLYLYSKSTSMRSQIAGWVLYDPDKLDGPELPSQEAPYEAVMAAVRDGWRIVQFPISKLYSFSDVDNDYLGYEFVLEKME